MNFIPWPCFCFTGHFYCEGKWLGSTIIGNCITNIVTFQLEQNRWPFDLFTPMMTSNSDSIQDCWLGIKQSVPQRFLTMIWGVIS